MGRYDESGEKEKPQSLIYIYIYKPKRKCFWNAAQVCGKDEAGQTVKLQITLLKSKQKKSRRRQRNKNKKIRVRKKKKDTRDNPLVLALLGNKHFDRLCDLYVQKEKGRARKEGRREEGK